MRPYLLIAAAAVALAACTDTAPTEPGEEPDETAIPVPDSGAGRDGDDPTAPPDPTPALTSTATASPTPTPSASPTAPATPCGADKAARFIGRNATPDVRAQVIEAVGHNRIRWIGPDTVVTMDYSESRLNADLTAADRITGFRCG
jgi:hypothetical protein